VNVNSEKKTRSSWKRNSNLEKEDNDVESRWKDNMIPYRKKLKKKKNSEYLHKFRNSVGFQYKFMH